MARKWAERGTSRPAHLPFIARLFRRKGLLLWLVFFLLYAATTARDVLPADSGEFQLTAAGWGIAHPPGYPLYTVVSALWVRLIPLGSVPFRANLLSAALAATTLLLTADAIRAWAVAWGASPQSTDTGGLAAALLLGSAATFWAQATTANIRMPTLLFTAWGFRALARYRNAGVPPAGERARSPRSIPPLLELAIVLGLGVGHHPSIIFVAAGWALYLLLIDPSLIVQPRRWWKAVPLAGLAWMLPQLYLPLRDSMPNVPLAPGNLATWQGFWGHVLARGFGGDMFAFATKTDLALRLPLLPTLFRLQFPPVFLMAIGLSWLWLLWRHHKLALALLLSWTLHTFVTITYRAPQTIEYLMPAYLPMVIAFGLGVSALDNLVQRHKLQITNYKLQFASYALRFTFYVLLLLRFATHYTDFSTLAADTSIRARVAPLLEAAPPDALILADWRWATPLWVLQDVEGANPSIEIAYVYPVAGQDYAAVWRARAEDAGSRPLFTTHSFAWDGWTLAPVGGGFRLYRRPLTSLPDALRFTPLEANLSTIRLLGYRLVGDVQPGRSLELQLAWQAVGPQDPAPSFTARLWDAEGALLAQADRALGSDTAENEVRFTNLTLQMPIDHCTDVVHLTVGGYTVKDGTFQELGTTTLPELTATCNFPKLPVTRFWPGLVLDGGPTLRGIDYDTHGDANATAYLHWCGPGPALTISAGEHRATVETLKWRECQTVRLPVPAAGKPQFTFARADGSAVHLRSLPLPAPAPNERYVPFGDELVLVDSRTTKRGRATILDLTWRAGRPIVDDYAVSARFLGPNGAWLAMHDIQPGLGALPTLKWVTRDGPILDPHPFNAIDRPTAVAISVYERFRLTPLPSPESDVLTFQIPKPR